MTDAHTALGLALTAATVALLVLGYIRARRLRPFPAHGWLGWIALLCAEALLFARIEPVATYFTPIAWSSYILIADAAVLALTNRSRLNDAPIVVARLTLLSIPLWLIFEAYNLRLQNWTYVGVPRAWPAALLGYAWSFATITPAVFETSDLVQAVLPAPPASTLAEPEPTPESRIIPRRAEVILMLAGAACLLIPLLVPRHIAAYLFALVWIGFLLLLDPLNHLLGLPSFLGDLAEGMPRRFYGFLLAGWICGWLWEFWNYWAAAKWLYIFPMFQQLENLRNARARFSRLPPLCAGLLRDVRYRGMAPRLGEKSDVNNVPCKISCMNLAVALFLASFAVSLVAPPSRAGEITLPPEAVHAMNKMYGGDPDGAIVILHSLEQSRPESPLPFLLEGEAQWWKIYCANLEIKYGMIDAWKRGKKPEDDAYFVLADKVIDLAHAQIAKSDTADMHFYAGMGLALKVRLDVLRGENRAVARAGVAARAEFLRALELDPQMADATAGLGLYNYYVDSLSASVKILRFFMGIPGGSKAEGIRQMQMGH